MTWQYSALPVNEEAEETNRERGEKREGKKRRGYEEKEEKMTAVTKGEKQRQEIWVLNRISVSSYSPFLSLGSLRQSCHHLIICFILLKLNLVLFCYFQKVLTNIL